MLDNDSSVEIGSFLSPVPGFHSKSSDRGVVTAEELSQTECGFPADVDDENY